MGGSTPRRRASLIQVLAVVVAFLVLVPFLPLVFLTLRTYHSEVADVEREIQDANRHIALLAATSLETLLVQLDSTAELAVAAPEMPLPPPVGGVRWERVDPAGVVLDSKLAPGRIGAECGYLELVAPLPRDRSFLSPVAPWIADFPPTVLLLRRLPEGGAMVAVFDPTSLHASLRAWSRDSLDRHLYTVDSAGRLLFYSDLAVSSRGEDLRANPPIRRFLAGGEGALRYHSVVSGKERLGIVHRIEHSSWGVVVSADAGSRLLVLRDRYRLLGSWILFALAAAVTILLWASRRLGAPLLDMVRALRDPERPPHGPLAVQPSSRVVAEYDELVCAFDELAGEVAAIERELVQAEKSALMGRLASGLAHEMGTPLNVISGDAQFLLRKVDDDASQKAVLQQIIDQSRGIADMIRRLLDLSRPAELRLLPLHPGEVVEQTLEMVPGIARNITVVTDIAADVPQILADPKLLEHALLNLIVNACQAMPEGGLLRVEVAPRRPANGGAGEPSPWVELRVVDTGCGIATDDLERIFEPFFTTKAHGKGTGLGLAIVDRIVRQHRGRISVHSTPGEGSVFTLQLAAVLSGGIHGRAGGATDDQ